MQPSTQLDSAQKRQKLPNQENEATEERAENELSNGEPGTVGDLEQIKERLAQSDKTKAELKEELMETQKAIAKAHETMSILNKRQAKREAKA